MSFEVVIEEFGETLLAIIGGGAAIKLLIEVLNFVSSF